MIEDNERKELDLDNPIFTVYVNIGRMSRQSADAKVGYISEYFNSYENVQFFILAVDEGDERIEVLWKGGKYMNGEVLEDYERIKHNLVKISEILSDGISDEKLKSKLRKYMINDIIGEDSNNKKDKK
jgi:hypothetical protein